jgi:hypothetical protein
VGSFAFIVRDFPALRNCGGRIFSRPQVPLVLYVNLPTCATGRLNTHSGLSRAGSSTALPQPGAIPARADRHEKPSVLGVNILGHTRGSRPLPRARTRSVTPRYGRLAHQRSAGSPFAVRRSQSKRAIAQDDRGAQRDGTPLGVRRAAQAFTVMRKYHRIVSLHFDPYPEFRFRQPYAKPPNRSLFARGRRASARTSRRSRLRSENLDTSRR